MYALSALKTIGLVLVSTAFIACNNSEKWSFQEEVRLNTGELILIDRVALRNNVWPRMGNGGYQSVVNQWISQPALKIEWEAAKHAGHPISIGLVNRDIYIASRGNSDFDYCKAHPDRYVVTFWKQIQNGWTHVEQTDVLLDKITVNLLDQLEPEWGDSASSKRKFLGLKEKGARTEADFSTPPSIRQYLAKLSGGTCKSVLQAANLLPLEVAAPRSSDTGKSQ